MIIRIHLPTACKFIEMFTDCRSMRDTNIKCSNSFFRVHQNGRTIAIMLAEPSGHFSLAHLTKSSIPERVLGGQHLPGLLTVTYSVQMFSSVGSCLELDGRFLHSSHSLFLEATHCLSFRSWPCCNRRNQSILPETK